MKLKRPIVGFAAALCAAPGISHAGAQPSWDTTFAPGGIVADQFGGVNEFLVADVNATPTLFVAGSFTGIAGIPVSNIAALTAAGWSSLHGGLNSEVFGMTTHPIGGTQRVVAGGSQMLGTSAVMAWWDGSSWHAIGGGPPVNWTAGVGSFDSGNGPELYVSGGFILPDNTGYVARWNGSAWQGVGDGLVTVTGRFFNYTDASGPALYAVNGFVSGSSLSLGRWDGTKWTGLGAGINGVGRDLLPLGDALYVGGSFFRAGGLPANNVARWQNNQWSALGNGLDREVAALAVWDDGSGPAIYAGGSFNASGATPISRLAVWRGGAWQSVAGGVSGGSITALRTFDDDGPGPHPAALYVGGDFTAVGGTPVAGLARLVPAPPTPCAGDTNADRRINSADLSVLLSQFGGSVTPGTGADVNADGIVNGADLSVLLGMFGQSC